MSSGEADSVRNYNVAVDTSNKPEPVLMSYAPYTTSNSPYTYSYWWTVTVYYYQLMCPKPRCKTYNWCELDKTVACKKCGSLLKAVSSKADYEIPVK